MRIVGIDPSLSRTGICIIADADVQTYSVTGSSKLNLFQRQRALVNGVLRHLKRGDVAVFEDFGISARFAPSGRFCERIELCGMLKLASYAVTNFPWLSLSPTMLKSFVAGKSSAHKEDMLEAVRTKWSVPVQNDDEADAFGLARYAQAMLFQEKQYAKLQQKFEKYGVNQAHLAKIRFLENGIMSCESSVL